MSAVSTIQNTSWENSSADQPRRFEFERDSFAFANELIWEYQFNAASGRSTFARRNPKPGYAHRCFVLTRAVRQFLFHAQFDSTSPRLGNGDYQELVRAVLSRSPRHPSEPEKEIHIPGYEGLRQFSADHEPLLKAECGGAWRSYVLRSHWRMVFPITRAHQARTALQLVDSLDTKGSAVVHLVCFPRLSINHGMVLFGAAKTHDGWIFNAYDPNDPSQPTSLSYDAASRRFRLPANSYWVGGHLDVIEIYRNWLL